jgi:stage V sporulation protein G
MEITEVEISLVNEGRLRAYATVILDDCFKIRSLRIIEGPNGLFVGAPQLRREKGTPVDTVDSAQPLKSKARTIIEDRILAEYRKVIGDPMP